MFYDKINYIHYELTDICNARCPQCQRTDPTTGQTRDFITKKQQSLSDFQKILAPNDLSLIESIHFCGTYGDPIAATDLLEICKYIWKHNRKTYIFISTNGSLRSTEWWSELGSCNPSNLIVHFAIEGLDQEVHEYYRRHTNLKKIMNNAEAYINAGGRAHWQYLVFKHNEHQVEDAKVLSNKMGFETFKMVISDRFLKNESFKFKIKNESFELNQTEKYLNDNVGGKKTTTTSNVDKLENDCINCFAHARKEAYISVEGLCYPCCFLAEAIYSIRNDPLNLLDSHGKSRTQLIDIDYDSINCYNNNIFDIVNGAFFQEYLPKKWETNEPFACHAVCGERSMEKITYEN